ncbi:chromate efflux transporter [Marinicellulosiphila megalodicopiae]|uniref:chromate efflux transporter n=1 Tax=Marinicellulosiphila megalodicopiae TaxID=2724896 RepID=UPI003BB10918
MQHKNTLAPFLYVFITFLKLGLTSFGGPVAHIGYFRKQLVEKQKWVSESEFAQLVAICQVLPGPASSQLGFALGLLRASWLGGISAFIAFTLPSVCLLIGFVWLLPHIPESISQSMIHGLTLVALVVVADAIIGMSKKMCVDAATICIALLSLTILIVFNQSYAQILTILFAGVVGFYFCKPTQIQIGQTFKLQYGKKLSAILLIVFFGLLSLCFIPSLKQDLILLFQIFYKTGALVFGGGHVVLPLLENELVATELISQQTFISGYGASQAMPGPMFSFAAYLGLAMPEQTPSIMNALFAVLFIFLPGFLLVAAALPFWNTLSNHPNATKIMTGINAAVIGLLAATFYDPIITHAIVSWFDILIGLIGLVLLNYFKRSVLEIVGFCVLASMGFALI